MRQDSNLSPYDEFRIGGIGKVLNQIGLNQRKHHIIYKVSSGEFAIPMEFTGNVMEMRLIPKEEILEELSRLRGEIAVTMKWIHIGTIEIVIKATFKEGIDSEIHLLIMDKRINNLRDGCLGTTIGKSISRFLKFSRKLLRNKIEATLKIKEECKYEYVRYKTIQMNMEDKKDMQIIIKEHIYFGLIEPGISAYSSPGFLVRNHGEIKRGNRKCKVEMAGNPYAKGSWAETRLHLSMLAIPQDEEELVVYIDANDYRWAVVLIKRTTTGEEPCRYTGGLFTKQQAQVWHINEKEFFAV
ncbi:UNVERIFIED_CONTAM: movement protein [Sesamum calycinum]|uniref:Movement protein n=1 Tax=Sesamum calycinum TaxID=2727403 RepID=A0AAW2KVA0_9LAMI